MGPIKYPRTPHLPWSQGVQSDDRIISEIPFIGKNVVVTEKMDGENTTLYRDNLHARSLDSKGGADRDWVKTLWSQIRNDIPQGWRICGENLWARHSVPYSNLKSYFYGFSLWDGNQCLPWGETLEYFDIIGVTPVPILYQGMWDEKTIRNLGETMDFSISEGYVVRLEDSFSYDNFATSVAKFVRKGHVQTSKHWRHSTLVPNHLVG